MSELTTYDEQFLLTDSQWNMTWKQCGVLVKSGFIPTTINTIEKCVTIVLMGKELGLAPMTALNNISVIKGKPVLEAKLMLSLVLKRFPNCVYKILENTAEVSRVQLGRSKENASEFSFTITQARSAGLLAKDNWKNYPADMLLWRAISRGCRMMFPDVLTVTAHTADEIEKPIVIEPKQIEEKPKEVLEKRNDEHIKTSSSVILGKILKEETDIKTTKEEKKDDRK